MLHVAAASRDGHSGNDISVGGRLHTHYGYRCAQQLCPW